MELIPRAHHVLWFSATFLLLWGLSLLVRGLMPRKGKKGEDGSSQSERESIVSRIDWVAVIISLIVMPLAGGVFVVGNAVKRWSSGGRSLDDGGLTVFHAIAAGMLVFAVTLATLGWFRDAARGRKRCPKCWYDMASLAESARYVCPECGTDAKDDRGLRRTRRHRKPVVIAALLILVSVLTPGLQGVGTGGAKAMIPTTLMIAGMWYWPDEWLTNGNWKDHSTLLARIERNRAWKWQRRWVAAKAERRLAHTDMHADYQRTMAVWSGSWDGLPGFPTDGLMLAAARLASPDPLIAQNASAIVADILDGGWWGQRLDARARAKIAANADAVLPALESPDPIVVVQAATILDLVKKYPERVAPAILKDFPSHPPDSILCRQTYLLIRCGPDSPEVADAILKKLASPDPRVRGTVARGMYVPRWTMKVPPVLVARLEEIANTDPDTNAAMEATRALVSIKGDEPDGHAWLVAAASRSSGMPRARAFAFERLAYRAFDAKATAEDRALIAEGLEDADLQILYSSLQWIEALMAREDREVDAYLPAINKLLTHTDMNVRTTAYAVRDLIEQMKERERDQK